MSSSIDTEDSLKDTQFIDVLWLQTFGLHKQNVLDYFATSPFFDRNSNNQTLINQGLGMEFLPQMTGMEYSLGNIPESTVAGADLSNNRLFVINKCRRDNPQKTTILEIYYILDGVIYQSPMFLAVVKSRVAKSSNHMLNCYKLIQQYQDILNEEENNINATNTIDSISNANVNVPVNLTTTTTDIEQEFKYLPPFTNTLAKLNVNQ